MILNFQEIHKLIIYVQVHVQGTVSEMQEIPNTDR